MKQHYKEKIRETEDKISTLSRYDSYLSIARLAGFIVFVTVLIFSIGTGNLILAGITLVLLLIFTQIVLSHLRNQEKLNHEKTRKALLENEIRCLDMGGNAYYDGSFFKDPDHDHTLDMDVFGKKSLFHYINRASTGVGNLVLGKWLSKEYKLAEIQKRQTAIKELAKDTSWMEELRTNLYNQRISNFEQENLPAIHPTMKASPWVKYLLMGSYIILTLTILAIAITGANAVLLLIPVFYNFLLNNRFSRFIKTIRAQLEGREKVLADYHKTLVTFENRKFSSEFLVQMQQELKTEDHNATQSIAKLQNLSKKLDYSLSMLVGAFLNLFFSWDLLLCRKISLWFEEHARSTGKWFEVVGKTEALISLATLENNHPTWHYPTFTTSGFSLSAVSLGHPLIPERERVTNDFFLRGREQLTIITGSNMAGKSTFLRTIGVNIILAKAGSVVCAREFALSHFRIMTYLTITDSLTENTSTFYREIKRLKKLLDAAWQNNNILLLLDEMLRGTNSADKAKGSMAITRELIRHNVPAIIATHNLELAYMEKEYPENIENYYFDISIAPDNKMHFDYKLKHGICNTFNASLLLKEIGINIE